MILSFMKLFSKCEELFEKIQKILSLKHVYLSCHRHQIPPPHFQYWYVPSLYIFTTYVVHYFSLFVISVSILYPYPFLFIYSLKYLHLIRSPNPLVFIFIIFIYSLPIPRSLILSIFTLFIALKDLYKTW